MVGVQQAEPSVRIQILFFFASCIGKNLFPNQSVCSSAVSTHFLQVLHRPDDGSRLLQGGAAVYWISDILLAYRRKEAIKLMR